MGDYGFKDAGAFGGQDTNFNCLPDNVRPCTECRCPEHKDNKDEEGVCLSCQRKAQKRTPFREFFKECNPQKLMPPETVFPAFHPPLEVQGCKCIITEERCGSDVCPKYKEDKVFCQLENDEITMSKARHLLGHKYMEETREWYNTIKKSNEI